MSLNNVVIVLPYLVYLNSQAKTLAAGLEFQVVAESDIPLGFMKEMFTQLGKLHGLAALRYTLDVIQKQTQVNLRELPTLLK